MSNYVDEKESEIFDRLVGLRDDPDAFEAERLRILEENTSSFDDERKLRAQQFQWTIDRELAKYKNPLVRMERMRVMMYQDGLFKLNDALQAMQNGTLEVPQVTETATVLEFKKPDA